MTDIASGVVHEVPEDLKEILISNPELLEKWKIASDKGGSGNTANIGSINHITDIINGKGMFSKLGEKWFDDYWINFKKIKVTNEKGETTVISSLKDFVAYKKGDVKLIVPKRSRR